MNLVERIRAQDPYLVPYLLDWAGVGPVQPWGAATSFALEMAHGYGLIRGESDCTLTPVGREVARHLACDSDSGPQGENSRSEVEGAAPQSGLNASEGIAHPIPTTQGNPHDR